MVVAALFACSPAEPAAQPNGANGVQITDVTPTPALNGEIAVLATPALIDLAIYLPNEDKTSLIISMVPAEDSPQGLLSALVAAGVLPDVDYGKNITCTVADEELDYGDTVYDGVFVHLDLSDAFAEAVRASDASAQLLTLQILANTFVTHYDADGLLLSIEGTDLQTLSARYDQPILYGQFIPTQLDTSTEP